MRAGHVAFVASVLDDHTVLLDHANWGYGRGPRAATVDRGIEAVDCSLAHDWSAVCVFNKKFSVFRFAPTDLRFQSIPPADWY